MIFFLHIIQHEEIACVSKNMLHDIPDFWVIPIQRGCAISRVVGGDNHCHYILRDIYTCV